MLLVGMIVSSLIYQQAAKLDEEIPEYADGSVYIADPADSKMYRHELERFGGKAALLADDLNRWLSSLWAGRRLATLVGLFSVVVALLLFRAGKNCAQLPSDDRRSCAVSGNK